MYEYLLSAGTKKLAILERWPLVEVRLYSTSLWNACQASLSRSRFCLVMPRSSPTPNPGEGPDYQPLFGKMSPHSSIKDWILETVEIEPRVLSDETKTAAWEATAKQANYKIQTKKYKRNAEKEVNSDWMLLTEPRGLTMRGSTLTQRKRVRLMVCLSE